MTITDHQKVELVVRRALAAVDLSEAQWRVAEAVVSLTLAAQRDSVRLPAAALLGDWCRLDRKNLSLAFNALVRAGVLLVRETGSDFEVRVQVDADVWRVAPRQEPHIVEQVRARLLQLELVRPELDTLVEAQSIVAAEQITAQGGVGESPTMVNHQQHHPGEVCRPFAVTRTERELMDRLTEIVGARDMAEWGNDWRANWVRRHGRALTVAIDDYQMLTKEGHAIRTPGAWIKDHTRRIETEWKMRESRPTPTKESICAT